MCILIRQVLPQLEFNPVSPFLPSLLDSIISKVEIASQTAVIPATVLSQPQDYPPSIFSLATKRVIAKSTIP